MWHVACGQENIKDIYTSKMVGQGAKFLGGVSVKKMENQNLSLAKDTGPLFPNVILTHPKPTNQEEGTQRRNPLSFSQRMQFGNLHFSV